MASPDGQTRPFDARAAGTVFSDGAAVVVLRRLSDAVASGDTIYAVLLGAAVNNDGSERASFTAPSPVGQAAVIASAHDAAGIDARISPTSRPTAPRRRWATRLKSMVSRVRFVATRKTAVFVRSARSKATWDIW